MTQLASPSSVQTSVFDESAEPLSRAALRDVIDLALWAGQLLLQHGAHSERTETTVHHIGTGLGCNWLDVFISANMLAITTTSGIEFRTKIRRIVRFGGVNMSVIAAINELTREVGEGKIDRHAVRARLEAIDKMPRLYPTWLTVLLVGLGCAAFSRLFGGDWPTFGVTFVAASIGVWVRHLLVHRYFNTFLIVVVSSLVASLIAAFALRFAVGEQAYVALAACVLFLVPGVPLVNSIEDLITGHTLVGLARGITGILISLGIAIGLTLALAVMGIDQLWSNLSPPESIWADMLWAGIAALGFAILFNVPKRTLLGCAVCGATGHGVRYLLLQSGLTLVSTLEIASLAGAMAVGYVGLQFAKHWRVPRITFTVSGIIPMVPGTFAFGAMIALLGVAGGTDPATQGTLLVQAATNSIKTGLILTALAVGIAIPALIFQRERPVV